MIELNSIYKIGVLSIFSKFLVPGIFGSEEKICQKITPWCKNQVIDFCAMVYLGKLLYRVAILLRRKCVLGSFSDEISINFN